MTGAARPIGDHLRTWWQRRHVSQLALACDAEISTKHLSFIETGRARPSRGMVLRLAERLDIPMRERNLLLVAAGYAPSFPERELGDPALAAGRLAVDLVLRGHEPNPALAVDRHWVLVAANRAVPPLLQGIDEKLLRPPVNVLRLSLHPAGLAPRTVNLPEWRAHVLARLRRDIDLTGDPVLVALAAELAAFAPDGAKWATGEYAVPEVALPLRLRVAGEVLSFLSTTTVFGTPIDVTLAELAIESFFPADQATAAALRRLAGG